MAIVGFNLEKINVEKLNSVKGQLDIKNNIIIKNIQEKELSLGDAKKDGLKLTFEYATLYNPDIGSITITGHLLYLGNQKQRRELLKTWEKDRKLTKDLSPEIINTILMRCSVKTLTLAQEVNLPPNISIPYLKPNEENASSYIG